MEHRTFHRILAAIIAVLIVLAGYGVYYVNDYHHAINVGNAIQSNPTVKVTDIDEKGRVNLSLRDAQREIAAMEARDAKKHQN